MEDLTSRCLESFADWLVTLTGDAQMVLEAASDERFGVQARCILAGAVVHLLKSVDLIRDGIEDLGYLEDAVVLRVACAQAVELQTGTEQSPPVAKTLQEAQPDGTGEELSVADDGLQEVPDRPGSEAVPSSGWGAQVETRSEPGAGTDPLEGCSQLGNQDLETRSEPGAGTDSRATVERLARESGLLRELLGPDYPGLDGYVRGLAGIGVEECGTSEQLAALRTDLDAWMRSYQPPGFGIDPKNLVKFRSFLLYHLSHAARYGLQRDEHGSSAPVRGSEEVADQARAPAG